MIESDQSSRLENQSNATTELTEANVKSPTAEALRDFSYIPFPLPVPGLNHAVKGAWAKRFEPGESDNAKNSDSKADTLSPKEFKVSYDRNSNMHSRACSELFKKQGFQEMLIKKHGDSWKNISVKSQKSGPPNVRIEGNSLIISLSSDKAAVKKLEDIYLQTGEQTVEKNVQVVLKNSLLEHASIRGALDINRRQFTYLPYSTIGSEEFTNPLSSNYLCTKDLSEEFGILIKFADKKQKTDLYSEFLMKLDNSIVIYQSSKAIKNQEINKFYTNLDEEFRAFFDRYQKAVTQKTEISITDRIILGIAYDAFCNTDRIEQLMRDAAKKLLTQVHSNLETLLHSSEPAIKHQELLTQTWNINYALSGFARIFSEGHNLKYWSSYLLQSVRMYVDVVKIKLERELIGHIQENDTDAIQLSLNLIKEQNERLLLNDKIYDSLPRTYISKVDISEQEKSMFSIPFSEQSLIFSLYSEILNPERELIEKLNLISQCLKSVPGLGIVDGIFICKRNTIRAFNILPYTGDENLQKLFSICDHECRKLYQEGFHTLAIKTITAKIGKESDEKSSQLMSTVIKSAFPFYMELLIREIKNKIEGEFDSEMSVKALDYFLDFPDTLAEIDPNSKYAASYAMEALELAFELSLDNGDIKKTCHYYNRINQFCSSDKSTEVRTKANQLLADCELKLADLINDYIGVSEERELANLNTDFNFINLTSALKVINQLNIFSGLPIHKFPKIKEHKDVLKKIIDQNNLWQKIEQRFKSLTPYITGLTDPTSVARDYLNGTRHILANIQELRDLTVVLEQNKDWLRISATTLERLNERISKTAEHVSSN